MKRLLLPFNASQFARFHNFKKLNYKKKHPQRECFWLTVFLIICLPQNDVSRRFDIKFFCFFSFSKKRSGV
jgi:hypothetical protein